MVVKYEVENKYVFIALNGVRYGNILLGYVFYQFMTIVYV